MEIGCVKEIKKHEYRVGLTPENVSEYLSHGHEVYIEEGAGEGSSFSDSDYAEAGAQIISGAAVWQKSDMIIKVKEPIEQEWPLIRPDQIIYTYLHLAANRELTDVLINSGASAVAYETIRDKNGGLPLLKPMSEVAGRLSVLVGERCLEKPNGGTGILIGGVPGVKRAKVLILGGGVVGTNSCKVAVGLGADVTVMDNNIARLAYLDDIFGQQIHTLYCTDSAIQKALTQADLVIGAVLIPGAATPRLIKKEYLSTMKKGSVIVDVAVDQGGLCETTRPTYHDNPTYVVDGVIHYCVANMPGAVSQTSTTALTNATLSYGILIADNGLEVAARLDKGIALGINCYKKKLTIKEVADAFGMEYAALDKILS